MTASNLPEPSYLRQRLRYCSETGKLFWLDDPALSKHWRSRWANKEAFFYIGNRGYLKGTINGRTLMAHRVIWAMVYNEWPSGDMDHIDHCRTNNKLENLRLVSKFENMKNQSMAKNNTTGVTGVYWSPRDQKWLAQIRVNKKQIYLGIFSEFNKAVQIRKAAERNYKFHENHGLMSSI
jgi:hypothetical protein